MTRCVICRRIENCTRHHLIPRKLHRRLKRNKAGDRDAMHVTVPCCPPCHKTIHTLFSEKELAQRYASVELLLGNRDIRKWREWIMEKPVGFRPRTRRSRSG